MFLHKNYDENSKKLKNYILFHKRKIYIDGAILYNNNLLYCQNHEDMCYIRQKSRGEEYVGSLKDKFDDNDHTIAFWYTDYRCKFFKGLYQLLKKYSESNHFKFKITHSNKVYEKHKMDGTIYFYLHKDYYLDLFEQDTVPLIMRQFLNEKQEKIKMEFKESIPLESDKLPVEDILKVKLFKHQRDNINWMKTFDRNVYLDTKNNYNITYIESLDEYILYDNKYKFYKLDKTKKVTFQGGLICDEVGLGKTLTCFGYISLKDKNLILVPARLVKQWVNEFEKYFGKIKYPIIPFSSVRSLPKLKKFTHGIIVCPITIFASPKYNNELSDFKFDRVFIDEAHEVLFQIPGRNRIKDKLIYDNLFTLKTKEKWLLTATPLEKLEHNAKSYFEFLTGKKLVEKGDYQNYIISQFPYRFNTKESIKKDIQLPDVSYEKIYLKMTPIERTLYNAAKETWKNKFNYVLISK